MRIFEMRPVIRKVHMFNGSINEFELTYSPLFVVSFNGIKKMTLHERYVLNGMICFK